MKDSDDSAHPEVLPERPQSPHPNYVTPAGLQRLRVQAADLAARLQEPGITGGMQFPQHPDRTEAEGLAIKVHRPTGKQGAGTQL